MNWQDVMYMVLFAATIAGWVYAYQNNYEWYKRTQQQDENWYKLSKENNDSWYKDVLELTERIKELEEMINELSKSEQKSMTHSGNGADKEWFEE